MNIIETIYKDTILLLEYEDYPNLVKKIIDLTLDTQNIAYYQKTMDFLRWLENNQKDIQVIQEKFKILLDDIIAYLTKKDIPEPKVLLEVNQLTKSYAGSAFTMGPIDLKVSEGEIIGLVGENGNGKTTLLRSLAQELAPTQGDIKYNFEYRDMYDLRTKLIYIPQRTKDWHGSLLDNLRFTASSYAIKGLENELMVDLIIMRMGLWQYRDFHWKRLSSGYKMRFELARMLLRKPKLLLIDEPLANLDIVAQQVVLDDFRGLAKSVFRPLGVVLSSQQLYEVEKTSDQVLFLKKGKHQQFDSLKTVSEEGKTKNQLVIEFESEWNQEKLRSTLSTIGLTNLQTKGGTYVATFEGDISQQVFLRTIVDEQIPLIYFRDISNSTRRFFLS